MNTAGALRAIMAAASGFPVVFCEGDLGRLARLVADHANHPYLTGPDGLASSVGIGVAVYTRVTTIVVDQPDGVLANLAAVVTAGTISDLPLVHVVLDAPAAPARVGAADLCGLALAAGYRRTRVVHSADELAGLVRAELASCPSPLFVRCRLAAGASATRIRGHRSRYRTPPPNRLPHVA
jgi:sulfopyruvate decarboxylase subunit beta